MKAMILRFFAHKDFMSKFRIRFFIASKQDIVTSILTCESWIYDMYLQINAKLLKRIRWLYSNMSKRQRLKMLSESYDIDMATLEYTDEKELLKTQGWEKLYRRIYTLALYPYLQEDLEYTLENDWQILLQDILHVTTCFEEGMNDFANTT